MSSIDVDMSEEKTLVTELVIPSNIKKNYDIDMKKSEYIDAVFSKENADSINQFDLTNGLSTNGPSTLTLEFENWPGSPGVVLAFGDDKVHKFSIEFSTDGEKWKTIIPEISSKGIAGQYEKYIFECPVYHKYLKINLLDACSINEISVLGVE